MPTSDAATIFAVIREATGAILRIGTGEIDSLADQHDHETEIVVAPVPEGVGDDTHFWDGEWFAEYPPRPGDWAVWDGAAWTDPRTPEDLAADAAARLAGARAAAALDKADLLLALWQAEILTPEDAEIAAGGQIPPTFAALLADQPDDVKITARIKWAADTRISRMNPLILLAAWAADISDAVLDQIFGVTS